MALGLAYTARLLTLATAYKAKLLCSGVFVSERDPQDVISTDLAVDSLAPLKAVRATVDREKQLVRASLFGGLSLGASLRWGDRAISDPSVRTALYRPGLGSTLVLGTTIGELRQQSQAFDAWRQHNPRRHQSLLAADTLPPELDAARLTKALENAFTERNPARLKRTRAVVVVYKGRIIAERYAPGFSATTPMLGWSMAKSVINALIGILVQQGKLSLTSDHLLAEWRSPTDPRRHITLDQLLRMSSGLQFSEIYSSPLSDATTMLFQKGDNARYAAALPLVAPPDTQFSYASGTTILLCRILKEAIGKEAIGKDLTDYFSFPQRALFDPLGMASAVLEPDAAGTFTGSSFMYATARDWAKLGLLYLQDGCWQANGQHTRLLPSGWVNYTTQPNKTTPYYGAHFWQGVPLSFTDKKPADYISTWPKGAYLASGYQGQMMTIIPSHQLVVVRLGLSQRRYSWDQEQFIDTVMSAFRSR